MIRNTKLLYDICQIYGYHYIKNSYGSYNDIVYQKYNNVKCRIRPLSIYESIKNGKEKEFPSEYRIYFIDRKLVFSEKDIIVLNGINYDIQYINRLYRSTDHIQIDVKLSTLSIDSYLMWDAVQDNYYITENNYLIMQE